MMEQEEEDDDEWRRQQFIHMFMWSNPVVYEKLLVLQFAKSYKLILKN